MNHFSELRAPLERERIRRDERLLQSAHPAMVPRRRAPASLVRLVGAGRRARAAGARAPGPASAQDC